MSAAQQATATAAQTHLRLRVSSWVLEIVPPAFLFGLTLLVLWQYDPWHRSITGDPAIFAFISQLVAQGLAPHKYAFNEQASLTFLVGGAAMVFGDRVGLPHLLSFRLVAAAVLACIVTMTYVMGWVFTRSRTVGFLAGAMMVGYQGLDARSATTLEPKTFMLLLGLAALYMLYRRKWLMAGAVAGATGLAWQIGWGYLLVTLLLAAVQGGNELRARARATGLALVGALGIFCLYALYFVTHGALGDMLQQTLLAPLVMHEPGRYGLAEFLDKAVVTFDSGFRTQALFGLVGLAGLVVWLAAFLRPWRTPRLVRRVLYFLFQNRRTAGILLVTGGFIFYTYLDLQNYPDWIPLLPYSSIFAAWLLWRAIREVIKRLALAPGPGRVAFAALAALVLAVSVYPTFTFAARDQLPERRTWMDQQRVGAQLNQKLGPAAPLWILGPTELLFFMGRHNVNKYIYVFGRVDAAADRFEPGGFKHVIAEVEAQKPVLFALGRFKLRKFASRANFKLLDQMTGQYIALKRCPALLSGLYMVRSDRADQLFPPGAGGCLTRS